MTLTTLSFNRYMPPPRFLGNHDGDYASVRKKSNSKYACTGFYGDNSSIPQRPNAYLLDIVSQQGQKLDVLDLGCNTGANLIALAKQGHHAYGVDIADKSLEKLQRATPSTTRDNIKTQRWDFAENCDVPWNKKFDVIYSTHVFSHLSAEKLQELGQSFKKYLKPGGQFVFTIIDKSGFDTKTFLKTRLLKAVGLGSKLSLGYGEHSEKDVMKAFKGYTLLKEHSRFFKKGELDSGTGWKLPEKKLRWYVFRYEG